jgi:hypothetical protein
VRAEAGQHQVALSDAPATPADVAAKAGMLLMVNPTAAKIKTSGRLKLVLVFTPSRPSEFVDLATADLERMLAHVGPSSHPVGAKKVIRIVDQGISSRGCGVS